ncbi:MAG: hypothetical protein KA143_06215, partial [Saprospiraceae bacterium]|nr:hypothetical protein [Saprospiraceae bacterium]
SLAYYISSWSASGKYLPRSIRFKYTGMYPVITDSSSAVDWRGNIAFNGKTLRADGIQSAWCPILYDIKTDTRYENVTYDLDISCADCQVIYLNGSEPVSGTRAKLSTKTAQDLTLFAGDYKATSINGHYFLNPDANEKELTELEKTLHSFQDYLEKKSGIPYKGKMVYIQTTPVSKNNSWLFVSYPSIVKVGWDAGMKSFLSKTEGPEFLFYMTHEIAHYYFGRVRSFNAEIGDMISEGFAEFLALQMTRQLISKDLYEEKMKSKVRALQNLNPVPVAGIRSKADYKDRELYVYYYAPLIFSAIEKEIGEEKMWAWIKLLLQSPVTLTNYAFFEETLEKALNDKNKFDSLRTKYLTSELSLQHAISTLNLKEDRPATPTTKKAEPKTYFYFILSRPFRDIGSSQNNMITHTAIQQITCSPEEFSKILRPFAIRVKEACINETGSTNDLNSYGTKEEAEAALKRWLDRYNKMGKMQIKIIDPLPGEGQAAPVIKGF